MIITQDSGPVNASLFATDRITTLLGLPSAKGYCTHSNRPVHMQSLMKSDHQKVTKLACKSWICLICSARLREKAGQHFGMKLLESSGNLFEEISEPSVWERQRKRLLRLGASWVRIGSKGQSGVILGSIPSTFGRPICDQSDAVVRLGKALSELKPVWSLEGAGRRRPINNSRDWKSPKKLSKYKRLGWVSVSQPQEIRSALSGLGIDCRVRHGTGSKIWDVFFVVPDGKEITVHKTLQSSMPAESAGVPDSLLEE
jgi:hypothetical protein